MAIGLEGLIAATFTPFGADGFVDLTPIPRLVDYLVADGVRGLFVNGSTGEGESLTADERCAVAEAYVEANRDRLPVIVQVGHNSVRQARQLANHAATTGVDAIAATSPCYFKPRDIDALVDSLAEIADAAPDLPFFYYHIPAITGVDLPMVQLLEQADRIPSLAGIKYSKVDPIDLPACLGANSGRWEILFGCDEMLLTGLTMGCPGAVGTTYNFAAPIYNAVIAGHRSGDLAEAARHQRYAAELIGLQLRHGGPAAFKATMALIGIDCGPQRLPNRALTPLQREALRRDLDAFGFFERIGRGQAREAE